MAGNPKLTDIGIQISEADAEKIIQGTFPFEILLTLTEIDNWVILSKKGAGEIFVASDKQTFNLIHWLEKGDNSFSLKICNSAPGPYNTVIRYKLGDQKWKILLALHRTANVPCVINRTLLVTSPVDFTQISPPGYPRPRQER